MPTLKLYVRGMGGRGCEERIQEAVRGLPGVYGVVADHVEGTVRIDFEDDEVAAHELLDRVRSLGYDAALAG